MLRHASLAATVALAAACSAAHIPGGTLSYKCLGNNLYEVTLVMLRECSGAPAVNQIFRFKSDCGISFNNANVPFESVQDISPLCAAELPNSTCNGGTQLGLEAYTYRTIAYLAPCNKWTISWYVCCRNTAINLMLEQSLYVEALLDNTVEACNDSPVFSDNGLPYVCVGQPVSYAPGVTEVQGHTLRYRFIEARWGNPDPFPVTYLAPHHGLMPWTGMTIDSISGTITFTPTMAGYIVTVVKVDEYNANGMWIGSVMRDFPFVVSACSNTPPPAGSGMVTGVSGAGAPTGSYAVATCPEGTVCITATFTDPNPGQSLTLTTNAAIALPGSAFSVSGTNPAVATVCWNTTGQPPGTRSFIITASDDHCPIRGMQTYAYSVSVEPVPYAGSPGTAAVCSLSPPFQLLDSLNGGPPPGGSWLAPGDVPHGPVFTPGVDPAGVYTYLVGSVPGCQGRAAVTVTYLPGTDPYCISLGSGEAAAIQPRLFPSLTAGELVLQGIAAEAAQALRITDTAGRTLARPLVVPGSGEWRIVLPPALGNGCYLLHTGAHGASPTAFRFVLAR